MKPLISIIVPIFEGPSLVSKCIRAIQRQSLDNFVCYIINDNSINQSQGICKAYSLYDPRFIIIDKKNFGISNARNQGLKLIKSKYVMFIDCNETPFPNMLEELYNIAQNNNSDVTIARFIDKTGDNIAQVANPDYDLIRFNKEEAISYLLSSSGINPRLCAKLFNFNTIKNVYFDDSIFINEDLLFIFTTFLKSDNIVYSDKLVCLKEKSELLHKHASFGKMNLSSLMALSYIMKGLENFDFEIQTIGVKFIVEETIITAVRLFEDDSNEAKEAKHLSKRICELYFKHYVKIKTALKHRKLFCAVLAINFNVFKFVYKNLYKPYKRIKIRLVKYYSAKDIRLSKGELKEINKKIDFIKNNKD